MTHVDDRAEARAGIPRGASGGGERPVVRGKFIYVGGEKLYVRGVTYGTFRPGEDGSQFPAAEVVEQDFASMAEHGINAIRTYTVPPRWLLDAALRHGLWVMVGLPWEQHVAFLDDRRRMFSIKERVRAGVRSCAGHPSVLCYAVGNEIPATILRWHGHRRVEKFLKQLCLCVKAEDAGTLVTYVNYPTTEYLQLPFVDILCFNVYLESRESLTGYLARLQNIAGERPLLMAEIGFDSRRNGELAQAETLEWQVRTAFASGCAGAFVFAWTDEWHRGGHEIEDWDFGLTRRNRRPKPALARVRSAFAEVPFPKELPWPRVSVVVCSYNGARTIRDCLEGLRKLEYPNYEVIVVNDGSEDATAEIARAYEVRLISTENCGLSSARNTGMEAATGEIVAYIDDDAYPDPHWLTYLAATFKTTEHAVVGGPNLAPPGDGRIAECVANAPGGPIHVLLSDEVAEHIPGCNMAFRKSRLKEIGGFDVQYRVAGDDVDVCWRLQERGWTIGFSPAAMVWHHRRNSIRAYWRQQKGYGKAEALLERKWPEKYTALGHLSWSGRLYGKGWTRGLQLQRGRVYQGMWGSALFQSLYQPAPGRISSLPMMPEWYLLTLLLALLSVTGTRWAFLPLLLLPLAAAAPVLQAMLSAAHASYASAPAGRLNFKLRALTALLHLLQPLARLYGRLRHGLTPLRQRGVAGFCLPRPRMHTIWSEVWESPYDWLRRLESGLRASGVIVRRSREFDTWDLDVRGGVLGGARTRMSVEEHGAGRQLIRFRLWPRFSALSAALSLLFAAASCDAAVEGSLVACVVIGAAALLPALRTFQECSAASSTLLQSLRALGAGSERADEVRAPSPVRARQKVQFLVSDGLPRGIAWPEVVGAGRHSSEHAILRPTPPKPTRSQH